MARISAKLPRELGEIAISRKLKLFLMIAISRNPSSLVGKVEPQYCGLRINISFTTTVSKMPNSKLTLSSVG